MLLFLLTERWITVDSFGVWTFLETCGLLVLFSRSLSYYMTVVIAIYCYIGIAHPLRARRWFCWGKVKLLPLLAILVAIALNIPRFTSLPIKNEYRDIPSLRGIEYITIRPDGWWNFWHKNLFGIHDFLAFLLPLPTLVIFNCLSYRKMLRMEKSRKTLTFTETKVKPIEIFFPVVCFLFICNIGHLTMFMVFAATGIIYRELTLMLSLWNALNCSVNFVMYYFRSSDCRRDSGKLFLVICSRQNCN